MSKQQRWYKGFYYRGNPKQLVDQISKQVQQYNLSQMVPLLRMEKGVEPRKQFYFFLAIESTQPGQIPTEVSHLLELNYFNKAIPGAERFNYEQIKSMVGIAHDVHDYTHNIPYQPKPVSYNNPFYFMNLSHRPSSLLADNEEMSRRYERLLYWLSALGGGSWESFKKACQSLKLTEPKRILRRFKLLGHIESDGSRWTMSPTALVKTQEFVLCGQRSLKLVQRLEQLATVTNQADAPPCIQLAHNASDQIKAEFSMIDAGNASSKLGEILPDIDTWQQSLRNLQGIVPSSYDWKYFDGNDFVDCISPKESGLYQLSPREKNNTLTRTLFYDQANNRWLQGDWYGLRFLALQHNKSCLAHFAENKGQLTIPSKQRWPEIYERALVLASGLLPTEQSGRLVYERISPKLATQLTDKLGVKLT